MKRRFTLKRIALLSLLCAGALCAFVVENLVPAFIVPGAKLGLGNVFTMFALVLLGNAEGIILVVVKSVLGSLIIGNVGSLIYSLSAGLISVAFSAALLGLKREVFTLTAISVGAAVLHNAVQTAVFCLVTETVYAMSFMPYLALTGVLGGAIVGVCTTLIIKKTPASVFEKITAERNKEDRFETEKR